MRLLQLSIVALMMYGTCVQAMDYNDKVDFKVLGFLEDSKTMLIDRGKSDFVETKEHIRIYDGKNFVGRAYSLDIGLYTSLWMVYFIQDEIPLRQKDKLSAQRMPKRFVPKKIQAKASYSNVDDLKLYMLDKVKKSNKDLAKELTYAFTESMKEDDEKIPIIDVDESLSLNPDILVDEITGRADEVDENFLVSITASPIQFETRDDARNIAYGVNISSLDWGKKEFTTYYNYSMQKRRPTQFGDANEFVVSSSRYDAGITFDYNNFHGDWTYFCFARFQRERDGSIYPVRYRYQVAPLGFKYDFYESKTIPDLSLSYAPTWEVQDLDIFVLKEDDDIGLFFDVEELEQKRIRHSFRFRFKWLPTRHWSVSNTFWYRPAHDTSNTDIDYRDSQLSNQFRVNYLAGSNFTVGYENLYTYDIQLKRLQKIPSSNMIHTFLLGYNFRI